MYDEATLHRYGTPLPPLEEDEVPSKKPIRPEDQIVTDENGKRRFHGAFTGGFSAGYWNTVGSQEGWMPTSFKSSRSEKAPAHAQRRPEDYMDAEDMGEFGIAPQRMQVREEFADDSTRKRKYEPPSTGVIPGRPVLELLLQPREHKIGERILKSMGWRPGQGIGPRQTREQKKKVQQRRQHDAYLRQHYGAPPGQSSLPDESSSSNSDNEEGDDEITYAPDDYEPYVFQPKNDFFGIGYKEFLSRDPALAQRHANNSGNAANMPATAGGHINLFPPPPPPLQLVGKNNKTLSITGQAFGVGALEEDDEDIYARDDMARYDFSLEDKKNPKEKKTDFVQDRAVLEGFQRAKNPKQSSQRYVVELPEGWKPRNWLHRKTRFEPLDPKRMQELERSFKRLEPKERLTPEQRGMLLEDNSDRPSTSAQALAANTARLDNIMRLTDTTEKLFDRLAQIDRFTSGGVESSNKPEGLADQVEREQHELLQKARIKTKSLASALTEIDFKPFINDEAKQKRYVEFLAADVTTESDIHAFLNEIQPIHFSNWDREMEKKEFEQAKKIYKPLEGSMAERFVSEAQYHQEQKSAEQSKPEKSFKPERSRCTWKPVSLLCKRFNIAEPYGGATAEEKQQPRSKLSIFNYLEESVNKKSNFQTPVIIPKHMGSTDKPRPIVRYEKIDEADSCTPAVSRSTPKSVQVDVPGSTNKYEQRKTIDKTESCGTGISISSNTSWHKDGDKDSKSQESLDIWLMPASETDLCKSKTNPQKHKEAANSTLTPGRYKPKTVLEKLVEEARDKPAWDKVDIYHAIFDNSSDDDSVASGDNEPVEVTVITKRTSSSQTPKGDLPGTEKPSSANILRNTSPPRGIFKVLFPSDKNKEVHSPNPDTKGAQNEKLKDLKSRLCDQLTHTKESSAEKEAEKPVDAAAATTPNSGPVRIVFQPKSERLGGAGADVQNSSDTPITAPVYGPKMPDFFKSVSISDNKETFGIISESNVDKKLRRLLETNKAAKLLPTIEEEEHWVEKELAGHDDGSSVNSDSSSESDSDVSGRKQSKKKRSKKKKHKKRASKESDAKGKKVKKKSKKSKKSHKSKKSKTPVTN